MEYRHARPPFAINPSRYIFERKKKKKEERKKNKKENSLLLFLTRTRSALLSSYVALCHPPPPPIPIYRTFNNAGIRKMRARNVAPGIFDENFLAFPAKLAASTGRDFCLPPLDNRGGSDVYGEILTDPPTTSGIIIEEEVVRSEFFEFSTSFPR